MGIHTSLTETIQELRNQLVKSQSAGNEQSGRVIEAIDLLRADIRVRDESLSTSIAIAIYVPLTSVSYTRQQDGSS